MIMLSQLAAASLIKPGKEYKCTFSLYPMWHHSQKIKFFVEDCDSMVHPSCYDFLCINKQTLDHFSGDYPTAVVCSKHCHNKAQKMVNKSVLPIKLQNLAWNRNVKMVLHAP